MPRDSADAGPVRPRRPHRSWDERRPEVLAAARAEFTASGYAATTMRSIADAADANEALLYRYFSTKEQLFEEAVAAPLEDAVVHSLVPAFSAPDIDHLTERFFLELLEAMRELAPLLNVVLADEERGKRFYLTHFQSALERVQTRHGNQLGRPMAVGPRHRTGHPRRLRHVLVSRARRALRQRP